MKHTKIVSIANQKGGVGKTTTTMNLGAALEQLGKHVLMVDLDAQANLTSYLSGSETPEIPTIGHLMYAAASGQTIDADSFRSAVRHNDQNHLDYIPADLSLSKAEYCLAGAMARETVLRRILKPEYLERYDYVLIDCLPSLGILLSNALAASDSFLVPVQTQKFAVDGLAMLMQVYEQVRDTLNPQLTLCGILPTMTDNTNMTRTTMEKLSDQYSQALFHTCIHKSVEAANSAQSGKSLCSYRNRLGDDYKAFAEEFLERTAD